MKRQIITLTSKSLRFSIRAILIFGLLFNSMSSMVKAQNFSITSTDVKIKYAGSLRGKPVFQVEFDNQDRSLVNLSITDEEGRLLFFEKLTQPIFLRNFQVDADESEDFKLILTLSDAKDRPRQVYSINGKIALVPDLVVTKL